MQTLEARELIRCCARFRDPDLWEQFFERFGARLRAGVQRAIARYDARFSREEREDLMQEVYCRLLEKRGRNLLRCRAEGDGAIDAYMVRLAESVVIDHLRAVNAAKRGRRLLLEMSSEPGADLASRAIDPRRTPEERLLLRERRMHFLQRCREMVGDRTQRRDLEVVYLAFFEGWTSREICQRLGHGMTPSTVDSLVHRLKRRLSRHGVTMPRRKPGAAPCGSAVPSKGRRRSGA